MKRQEQLAYFLTHITRVAYEKLFFGDKYLPPKILFFLCGAVRPKETEEIVRKWPTLFGNVSGDMELIAELRLFLTKGFSLTRMYKLL